MTILLTFAAQSVSWQMVALRCPPVYCAARHSVMKMTTSTTPTTENTSPAATERKFSKVYVHEVSKKVLEALQSNHHEFMVRTGLVS
jgi:hypothetical protein